MGLLSAWGGIATRQGGATLTIQTDRETIHQLYERFNVPIYNFFANRSFGPDVCRDLVQETFLQAFRSVENFRGDAKAITWLWAIAKNVWREAERKRSCQKRAAPEISIEDVENSPATLPRDERKGPLDAYLDEERSRLLRDALEELPPQMRACVQLRIFQGLRYREIAEAMQTSLGTVKSQLSEARERIRSRLVSHASTSR